MRPQFQDPARPATPAHRSPPPGARHRLARCRGYRPLRRAREAIGQAPPGRGGATSPSSCADGGRSSEWSARDRPPRSRRGQAADHAPRGSRCPPGAATRGTRPRNRPSDRDLAGLVPDRGLAQVLSEIGDVTARTLLGQRPEISTIGLQFAALVGLAPIDRASGLTRGRRSPAGGRTWVWAVPCMTALTAARCGAPFRPCGSPIAGDVPERCPKRLRDFEQRGARGRLRLWADLLGVVHPSRSLTGRS